MRFASLLSLTMKHHNNEDLISSTMPYILQGLNGPTNLVTILERPPGGGATKYVGGVATRKIPPPTGTGGPPTATQPVTPPAGQGSAILW